MNDDFDEKPTIEMLLDPDNFAGEPGGRFGPILIFFLVAFGPGLIYAYFFWGLIPWAIVIPIYVIWVIRAAMITLGREKERVAQFKKQLNDEFASMYGLVSIKTLHPDGCCEYIGNKVAYFIVTTNKTSYDSIIWSQQVMDFLKMLNSEHDVDIYVQNITEVRALENRYKNVKIFADRDVAKDFLDIIDHNRSQVYSNSLLTRTIYVVRGYRNDWEAIKTLCNTAVHSNVARVFKDVHIANDVEVNEILSRDVNGLINLPELMQNKYCTHQYYGSKVVSYGNNKTGTGTTPAPVKQPARTGNGFMSSLQGRK